MSKRIGLTKSTLISITANDEDRVVSNMLNVLKRHDSCKGITAPETYRRVILRGLTVIFEEILEQKEQQEKESSERQNELQGKLFEE